MVSENAHKLTAYVFLWSRARFECGVKLRNFAIQKVRPWLGPWTVPQSVPPEAKMSLNVSLRGPTCPSGCPSTVSGRDTSLRGSPCPPPCPFRVRNVPRASLLPFPVRPSVCPSVSRESLEVSPEGVGGRTRPSVCIGWGVISAFRSLTTLHRQ